MLAPGTIKLGYGAYGSVERRGDHAVKRFNELSFLTQEYAAFRYLVGARNVVQVIGADPTRLELYLTLYEANLRQYMTKTGHLAYSVAVQLSAEIAYGLAEIHERNLTHGDIKPSNILLSYRTDKKSLEASTKLSVAIGDLGLTGPHNRSRCTLTAKSYCDPIVVPGPQHDIFALGIILIELFTGVHPNPKGDATYEMLIKFIRTHIAFAKLADFLVSMIDRERNQRPSAQAVYSFFTGKPPKLTDPQIPNGWKPPKTNYRHLYEAGSLPRPYKGYAAVTRYLTQNQLSQTLHESYHQATILLLYLLFGRNERLSPEQSTPELIQLGYTLLKDQEFVSYIMSISPNGQRSSSDTRNPMLELFNSD